METRRETVLERLQRERKEYQRKFYRIRYKNESGEWHTQYVRYYTEEELAKGVTWLLECNIREFNIIEETEG